jgi:tRNA-binding EMAP/Myf-like protein
MTENTEAKSSNINFDDFLKVKMTVGKVLSAEKVEGSPKLLKLLVDFGESESKFETISEPAEVKTENPSTNVSEKGVGESSEVTEGAISKDADGAGPANLILKPRQVLSGIAKTFQPEDLIGRSFAFVINLEPRSIMGMESQAMILAGSDEQGLVLFSPTREIKSGTELG